MGGGGQYSPTTAKYRKGTDMIEDIASFEANFKGGEGPKELTTPFSIAENYLQL